MNLKFVTFEALKTISNNLKKYLKKYNNIIAQQSINNITISTAIKSLDDYEIPIPTVELISIDQIKTANYVTLADIDKKDYPDITPVTSPDYPDIKNVRVTDSEVSKFKFPEVLTLSAEQENLRYSNERLMIIVAINSTAHNETCYGRGIFANGFLIDFTSSNSQYITLNRNFSNARELYDYIISGNEYISTWVMMTKHDIYNMYSNGELTYY